MEKKRKKQGARRAPCFFGTPDQTLTGGLPLRRRSLYTTELRGHNASGVCQTHQLLYPFHPQLSIQNETAAAIHRGGA